MKERVYSIYASTISIISFIFQLANINAILKCIFFIVSIVSLIALIVIAIFNNDIIKRKKLIQNGNKIILSAKEKIVLFGGDLSWTNDYINSIKKMCSGEGKAVEVFFPKSKYDNCDNNEEMLNRIILLQDAGAKIFLLNIDLGLRSILIDPDSYNSNDYMEIMITDRIFRHNSDSLKNKYTFRHLKYKNETQKNICRSYIANYYYIKQNCSSF